jgi:hypothetical protein
MMTPDDVRRLIGPSTEPDLVSSILRVGATAAELAEARAWVETDEVQINEHKPFPKGRVAELVEILESDSVNEDGP